MKIPVIELNNDGSADAGGCDELKDSYYPRLMVNKHGEIVLATHKVNSLTTGIYVGQVEGTEPPKLVGPVAEVFGVDGKVPALGKKWSDWEVFGDLEDYDGEVTITFKNEVSQSSLAGV